MPLARANWKVLLPTWRGLAGAGWLSLARLASLGAAAANEAAVTSKAPARAAGLEPVKPAAAIFLGCRGRGLAPLIHFGVRIDGPARVGRGRGREQPIGEAAIGILYRGALVGVEAGPNGGIGPPGPWIWQKDLFALWGGCLYSRPPGLGVGLCEKRQIRHSGRDPRICGGRAP